MTHPGRRCTIYVLRHFPVLHFVYLPRPDVMDKHVPHAYTISSPRRPIFWLKVSETRQSLFCPCGFEAKMLSDGSGNALTSLARHLNPGTPEGEFTTRCWERFPDHYLLQIGDAGPLFKLTRVDGKTIDEKHVWKVFRGKPYVDAYEALQLYLLAEHYQQVFSEDSRKRRHKV